MKKPPTKKEIRSEIAAQTEAFLRSGGNVNQVENGVSGRENADGPLTSRAMIFDQPRTSRTFVPEVVAAIDARQKSLHKNPSKTRKGRSNSVGRKKMIYDDFGEPLRWVWQDKN